MAKTFLDKLNTLIQSNVRDLSPSLQLPTLGGRLGKGIEKELQLLKEQIAHAEQDEIPMQASITNLEKDIVDLDAQADNALQQGNEAQARYIIEQLERRKQQLVILQSDLANHRRAVYELMQQVSHLESLVETAKQPDQQQSSSKRPVTATPNDTTDETSELSLSDAIRRARETATTETSDDRQTSDLENDRVEVPVSVDNETIDQDLTARRARLAKPTDKKS